MKLMDKLSMKLYDGFWVDNLIVEYGEFDNVFI